MCGDTFVGPGEQCDDGNQVNTDTCVACKAAACGDGFLQQGVEPCDGANLNGKTCVTQGFASGTLACNANCTDFNTSQCMVGVGNCCNTVHGAGCSVPSIQACVCALDPFCCNNTWDSLCVSTAKNSCGAAC